MAPSLRQLPNALRSLDDEAWLALLMQSIKNRNVEGVLFPAFPPEDIQVRFVGSSYEHTMQEAFGYYKFVKSQAAALQKPLTLKTRFLDFGCGWGRFLRIFWKDIAPENLFGCDVLPDIVNTCRSTGVPGNLNLIESEGRLPYPDSSFDTIIAYSVFTHLPERMNLHWMRELARVSRPGCLFFLTLEPRAFVDRIANAKSEPDNAFIQSLARYAPSSQELYRKFDAGEIVYLATGGGDALTPDVYGDAIVPLAYIQKNWAPNFIVKTYIDYPKENWRQALMIVQRSS